MVFWINLGGLFFDMYLFEKKNFRLIKNFIYLECFIFFLKSCVWFSYK